MDAEKQEAVEYFLSPELPQRMLEDLHWLRRMRGRLLVFSGTPPFFALPVDEQRRYLWQMYVAEQLDSIMADNRTSLIGQDYRLSARFRGEPETAETKDPLLWPQRVVVEFQELREKLMALARLLTTHRYQTLPVDEQDRLTRQLAIMHQYETVLAERIEHFPVETA